MARRAAATPALAALEKAGVAHTVHPYELDGPSGGSYGQAVAAALGVEASRLFKTLVAEVDGTSTLAVVPVAGSLDLKALAAARGGKRAAMAEPATAERLTGSVTGGIAPLGSRRRLPVVVDDSALEHRTVYCSAGKRGLQVELTPADLVAATAAVTAPIAGG